MTGNKKRPDDENRNMRPVYPEPDPADERGEDGTELGAVRIHHNVIAVISRIAALKVPGVVEMSGSFADGIASMIGKSSIDRGVRVELEGAEVGVELHVVIEFGVRIPQVAWRIQNDVCRAIEEMTGKKVRYVNVVVQGVKIPGETKKEEGETP